MGPDIGSMDVKSSMLRRMSVNGQNKGAVNRYLKRGRDMSKFTLVETVQIRSRCNHRLRFGQSFETKTLSENKTLVAFEAGQIFGYIRWSRNAYGTRNWQFFVVRSVGAGRVTRIPGISPGGDLLFRTRGVVATQRALKWLDGLEKTIPFSLSDLPESYWRLAENEVFTDGQLPDLAPNIFGASHA